MRRLISIIALLGLAAMSVAPGSGGGVPTREGALKFLQRTEKGLLKRTIDVERAEWVRLTYINQDTQAIAAQAYEELMRYVAERARQAVRFMGLDLPEEAKRKLNLLRLYLDVPSPADPRQRQELARIMTTMDSIYGKGKYCPKQGEKAGKCLTLGDLSDILARSRDYGQLLDAWKGWRTIAIPMKPFYERFVELANKGARDFGFADVGQMWRSRYDMPPSRFDAEVKRLWEQVEPLYEELHCYVRRRLMERYGKDKFPADGTIPAHLLGNMWAQDWTHIFDLVAPYPNARGALDLTAALKDHHYDRVKMVKTAEAFFVSLGLPRLPNTFWERSMFRKPKDREVVCHASAWDIDQKLDVRIKMCIKVNEEDFVVIHHELGHNYYQMAYRDQDPLFLNSANDGFHEAMGDLIALSVTPTYLKRIGLIEHEPAEKAQLNFLMKRALDKVAFLPFGLLVDKWRYEVFSGKVGPDAYNEAWWALRKKYQGISPPVERSEHYFDPGAKYHIPANVPYTRYFLADVLQFQFHRALCRKVLKFRGPLHKCTIYGSTEAGRLIWKMMQMGMSKPWPEALEVLTGERRLDASAILEYFHSLHVWLKKQNASEQCGWRE